MKCKNFKINSRQKFNFSSFPTKFLAPNLNKIYQIVRRVAAVAESCAAAVPTGRCTNNRVNSISSLIIMIKKHNQKSDVNESEKVSASDIIQVKQDNMQFIRFKK